MPGADQLVDAHRAAPWFVLYFAAVAVGSACGLLAWPTLLRLAVASHLLATLGIGIERELWRARHWVPARTEAAAATSLDNRQTQQGVLS